ncbi:glycosyl hydrolase family 18 protein [Spartinivicinus poritis]|uniref:Glycosyl hydrolase family 18 protein n=1 Tax=Spartinivicinus poritis TaxID=2994640 RepID=A0ABT5U743_9GAMM|nr:glycosyl hydrolase family 18 protein [Spartinivicinus sp. A2-2]MDE1462187.1 glycosyl hydrolase family 18 protein [Spartinivicinus sp. A2-2]
MNTPLMVGYLQSWSKDITFSDAAASGYDCIVMAFGAINGVNVDISDGYFSPSPTPYDLKEDIKDAKQKGAKQILFSVGGERNTYNPNNANTRELANNLISFFNEYGFTGIDFDLEIDGDSDYLDELCAALKHVDPNIYITAAPQLNQADHGSNLFLVSTGNAKMYDKAIANNHFDYLFIQAYNNPWPLLDGSGETDVDFISKSFNNLKKTIPTNTLITIGEPANKEAAGTSIFTVPNPPEDIYQAIAKQYNSIASDSQFGGAMVWSINHDKNDDYQFVRAVKQSFS